MQLGRTIKQLHDAEQDLHDELVKIADRHRVEQDIFHLSHTLAKHARGRAQRLAPFAERYGKKVKENGNGHIFEKIVAGVRRKQSEMIGRASVSSMLLLRDLRRLYVQAHEAEIAWVMVIQGAQAARDKELHQVAQEGREEVEKLVKWLKTRIKIISPQALVFS